MTSRREHLGSMRLARFLGPLLIGVIGAASVCTPLHAVATVNGKAAPTGSISGRVLTQRAAPLVGRRVVAFRRTHKDAYGGSNPEVVAKSAARGTFRLRGLRPGVWYVYAKAPKNRYVWQKVRVLASQVRLGPVRASNDGYQLTGRSPDDYGWLSGEAYHVEISWNGTARTSRQSGPHQYAVRSVPGGRYRISATCPEGGMEVNKMIQIKTNRKVNLGGLPCSADVVEPPSDLEVS